jgi:hypothetical protein
MHRTFTVVKVSDVHGHEKGQDNLGGVFRGKTPVSAAKKAMTQICRKTEVRGQCTLLITVRETTRGSANKEFCYKVKRIKNESQVSKGGVDITFKYILVAEAQKH